MLNRAVLNRTVFGLSALCLASSAAALAQFAVPVPPPGPPVEGAQTLTAPGTAVETAPAPAAPGRASVARTVSINAVTIAGNTAFPSSLLLGNAQNLTGPAVTITAIEQTRTAIVNRYRAAGFVYSAVNAHIQSGTLHFIVAEGHVTSVKLAGRPGAYGNQVLADLDPLLQDRPVTTSELERSLLLASDTPGVAVRGVLTPQSQDPGALGLVAQVSHAWFSGEITADNRAFRATGPEEILGQFNLNSLTRFGEQTQVELYHTPNNTNSFGEIVESVPLGGTGLGVQFYGGAGEADPNGSLKALGYDGFTRVFGAALSDKLIRSRQQNLIVTLNVDGLESAISTSASGEKSLTSYDSLRMARLQLLDTYSDSWLGASRLAQDSVNLRLSHGFSILGGQHSDAARLPRIDENANFTKINGDIERLQTLAPVGSIGSLAVKLGIAGQFSNDVLPPAEKYYLGGESYDRGFYYGQVTGDKAAQITAEPRYDLRLPERKYLPTVSSIEFYGFYDWGEVWQNAALDLPHSLRSAGGGIRIMLGARAEIEGEAVERFTRDPQGEGPNISPLPHAAYYWKLDYRF